MRRSRFAKRGGAQPHLCHCASGIARYGNNFGICLIQNPAAAKARVVSRLALALRAPGITAAGGMKQYKTPLRTFEACSQNLGRQRMKFILGVFVGAALMVGSAYVHDTGMVKAGPQQPFVNWDTVIGMLGQ